MRLDGIFASVPTRFEVVNEIRRHYVIVFVVGECG